MMVQKNIEVLNKIMSKVPENINSIPVYFGGEKGSVESLQVKVRENIACAQSRPAVRLKGRGLTYCKDRVEIRL